MDYLTFEIMFTPQSMWVWGGGQELTGLGFRGASGLAQAGRMKRSSLVRNEKISFLRRSSPTEHSDMVSQRKEGGFRSPRFGLSLMARGELSWLENLTISRPPSDASRVLSASALALHL